MRVLVRYGMSRLGRLALAAALIAVPAGAAEPLALGDLLGLLDAGIGNEVIETQVRRDGIVFEASAVTLLQLRRAGADDELLTALQDLSAPASPAGPVARPGSPRQPASPAPAAAPPLRAEKRSSVRVIRTRTASGREAIVLTNLDDAGGRRLTAPSAPLRGIISSSDRRPYEARPLPRPAEVEEDGSLFPSSIEVVVRRPEDDRLAALEERIEDVAAAADGEHEARVGDGFPQHPINDHRNQPIFAYYGFPALVPFSLQAQTFRVRNFGSFPSFTAATAAGVDPFNTPGPCVPGQACRIEQRGNGGGAGVALRGSRR